MLTSKQRSNLKALAANLQPVAQVGKGGINENMVKSLSDALEARELIKISVLTNAENEAKETGAALAEALKAGKLWGAGIDVFENEPVERNHPLLSAPHTVLTPHAAYWSEESGEELRRRAMQAAIDVVSGMRPMDCLNPEALRF